MKTIKTIMLYVALIAIVFTSCKKDDTDVNDIPILDDTKIAYIINYGSYSGTKSEISIYNVDSNSISHNAYNIANSIDFTSNIQSATIHNDIAYFMSNNGDKIDIVNAKTLVATANPISADITKPRFFIAEGNTAYVSCWGGDIWTDETLSYIAKIDLTSHAVSKIPLPGGPEGLAIANNKLYVALNYKDSIAVINMTDDAVSYIETPAVSSYFLKDNNDNLYVSFVSTYSDPSTSAGIGYLNTSTDAIDGNYTLDGISSNYGSIMQFNSDKSKIFVIAAAYDADWVLQGGIHVFNTSSKSFESPLVDNLAGINGVAVNPDNDNVYVLLSPNSSESGALNIYNSAGTLVDEEVTGIGPNQVIFYHID